MRCFALALLLTTSLHAADPVAARPPMGWNSWDAYGTTVSEAEVKAKGLAGDDRWFYIADCMDKT